MKDKVEQIIASGLADQDMSNNEKVTPITNTILDTLIEEVEGLYRPEITDLESNEYHGEDRPVIYLDQVINILKGDKDV